MRLTLFVQRKRTATDHIHEALRRQIQPFTLPDKLIGTSESPLNESRVVVSW